MSGKPTEEGWFWEWRTFGPRPDTAARVLEGFDVRGTRDAEGEDEYFVSDATDQNVKLRGDLLKLKLLFARLDDGLELHEETSRLIFALPVDADVVGMAASLLGGEVRATGRYDRDELARALGTLGGVRRVAARKRRTQFEVGDGWAELAEIEFPAARVWSLGVQSRSLSETRRIRRLLDPPEGLVPLGYVEACRRWG